MDWSSLTSSHYDVIAVLFLAMVVGRFIRAETRTMLAVVVVAVVNPASFLMLGLAAVLLSVVTKLFGMWTDFL